MQTEVNEFSFVGGKMKASRTITAALALIVLSGLIAVSAEAAPGIQGKKQDVKPTAKSSVPKEVAALIQEGLATKQGRQDIPFSFYKQLILPAQGSNLYPVFFFKAKNGDLGYALSATGSGEMETTLPIFYQFFRLAEDGTLKPFMGGKTMAVFKTAGEGYSAEKEDLYSFATAIPTGKYTFALVIGTPDLKKLSVAYSDITLPGPEVFETSLWPTDPVIVQAMDQVEPDQRPTVHQGCFTWGAVRIVSNENGEVASGENLEVFFFVLGAAYKDPAAERPVNELEVNFEVQGEDGKPAIRWAPQSYETFFVNQPLPLVQTLEIKDDKGNVRTDRKPLSPGKYSLALNITDKVTGKKADRKVAFSVK
jgi:hypothetical protein